MSFGLQIKNDAGTIQIDENYVNLALVNKQLGVAFTSLPYYTSLGGGSATYSGCLDISAYPNAVVAFRCSEETWCIGTQTILGTTFMYFYTKSPSTNTMDFYYFDAPANPPTSGMGLSVYNASGNVTFHSGYKYLRAVDQVTFANQAAVIAGRSLVYDTSRTYAIIYSNPGFTYISSGGTSESYSQKIKNQSGGFTLIYSDDDYHAGIGYGTTPTPPTYVVADVTNF